MKPGRQSQPIYISFSLVFNTGFSWSPCARESVCYPTVGFGNTTHPNRRPCHGSPFLFITKGIGVRVHQKAVASALIRQPFGRRGSVRYAEKDLSITPEIDKTNPTASGSKNSTPAGRHPTTPAQSNAPTEGLVNDTSSRPGTKRISGTAHEVRRRARNMLVAQ